MEKYILYVEWQQLVIRCFFLLLVFFHHLFTVYFSFISHFQFTKEATTFSVTISLVKIQISNGKEEEGRGGGVKKKQNYILNIITFFFFFKQSKTENCYLQQDFNCCLLPFCIVLHPCCSGNQCLLVANIIIILCLSLLIFSL